ncbi:hypothetical protein [Streptomyces abikoensis]|uniref:hypothetical protein n=1 Tax=Streptomyces abikoensis TaxID=97398 RepID=UPI0033DE1FCD
MCTEHYTEHCRPSVLPVDLTARMEQSVRRVFRLIGAHGALRADFLVTPDGQVTLLEANTLPGLSPQGSSLTTMARAGGIEYPTLIATSRPARSPSPPSGRRPTPWTDAGGPGPRGAALAAGAHRAVGCDGYASRSDAAAVGTRPARAGRPRR